MNDMNESGSRIDQLYYNGKGLKNISTKVVSEWSTGFPSDHFLIVSNLDYSRVEVAADARKTVNRKW